MNVLTNQLSQQIDILKSIVNPNVAKIEAAINIIKKQPLTDKTKQYLAYNMFCMKHGINPANIKSFNIWRSL